MQIRRVTVEFLRSGPRHNQLLSPLTQYLGVCGDSATDVVTLPYEHAAFRRRLAELRYEVSAAKDTGRRQGVLDEIGAEMAGILGQVRGLPGALNVDRERSDALTPSANKSSCNPTFNKLSRILCRI